MGGWEFLLQKEGDRAWLPLEPPSAEVLEGSYRLMARCPVAETSVEVQITHLYDDQGVPKQRYQRRTHRSSSTGLMGILPFTYLQPGRWEFQCRVVQEGVLDSDRFAIALDVLAQSEEWDLPAPKTIAAVPEPSTPVSDSPPPNPPEPTAAAPALPTTLIELPQSAYTIFADETLVLEGTVAVPGTVVIRLRNPVTRDVVQEHSVPAIAREGKWSFQCRLTPLADYPVMVGEARLQPQEPLERSDLRQVQAFMVTVLPAPEIPAVSAPPPAPKPAPPLSKTTAGPQLPVLADIALEPVPVSGFSLPPQLKPVKAPIMVDLPTFCQPLSAVTVPPPRDLPIDRQERFWSRLQQLAELASPAEPTPPTDPKSPYLLTPPQLMLSPEPLVSPLHLKVNLPATQRGCSVKVWITNGETGELIAGPRWLVEFDFYRYGDYWQTVLHIDVPASVRSIALMAIAIDPKTGAESPTVTLRRQLQVA
ncbi:hypothetical protein NBE99_01995 [Thermosynechococcus sp. HN-54]|uniref:hypothetical protein n=1 Tax=Thermosynechococcus sp. HN-54 TaxID=2933959 RepID=UPI00202CEE7A|nr:hypothetical protein [Thermosynechococcus sp. HN-54]URR35927.1 hypothetical protein NBE99_01995 [Thermosynechococcus sp. HN-54]